MFSEKGVARNFRNFIGKHLCQRLFFNKVAGLRSKACSFIKKESLAQVFYCEFVKFLRTPSFYSTPPVAASDTRVVKFTYVSLAATSGFISNSIKLFRTPPVAASRDPLIIHYLPFFEVERQPVLNLSKPSHNKCEI